MNATNYISKKENKFLIIAFSAVLILTVIGISSKFINAYNFAVEEQQAILKPKANDFPTFEVSDCFRYFPQTANFTLFSLFIFTISFTFWYFLKVKYLAAISAIFLTIWLLNLLFLHLLFIYLTNIEWNSRLIRFDLFDLLLWIIFPIILIVQTKIILRFAKEKFQAKISLR